MYNSALMSDNNYSIAIETTCREGGVALGVGEKLLETRDLGLAGRPGI